MIEEYSFGTIKVNNQIFTSDVIIYPDLIDDKWWRKSGHVLHKNDIINIVKSKPDVLIVGTGSDGLMEVPKRTIKYVESHGIELIVEKTRKACDIYNNLYQNKKIIAALHLTC